MAEDEMTPQQIMDRIPEAFQASKAQDLTATFQWEISGPTGGQWYVEIKDAQCQVYSGSTAEPNITISVKDEDFVKVITGKMDGTMAFMTGKLKIKGNMGLAMRLSGLFQLPG